MENYDNFYVEEHQCYDDDDNDNGDDGDGDGVGDGGVVGNNFTCEPIDISDTSTNNSLVSSSNDLSSGSRRPSKKRVITHSFVWKYFEKVKDSGGYEFVICKAKKIVNNNEIECNNKTKYYGSTSNMKLHLLSEHDISESGKLKVNIIN